MENYFSKWVRWEKRNSLDGIKSPGVYAIAICDKDITGNKFSWIREIIYIGMTRAQGGLKSRLQQFDNTIKGKEGHGGAMRFRFKYKDYNKIMKQLYVSIRPYECNVNVRINTPEDLRVIGDIVKHEYECLAVFKQKFEELPKFNDPKSLKK
ncbi:MAG: hypothetical protein PVG93_05885 [Phycisphaerales bacterium]|jgi:hypothetical protein